MGGKGSGRGIRWTKPYCEDYLKLDIRKIAKAGALKPHQRFNWQWTRRGGETSNINISVKDRLTVELNYTARDDNGNRVQINDYIEVGPTANMVESGHGGYVQGVASGWPCCMGGDTSAAAIATT